MSMKAREFVEKWVNENVHPTGYEPEGDSAEAKKLANACWRAVDLAGIGRPQVAAEIDDLEDFMGDAIERVNDAEVQRLVDKDRS